MGVFKQSRVGYESFGEEEKATEHKRKIVDESTYLPKKITFGQKDAQSGFCYEMSAYEIYIGKSDGAAKNAIVGTELLPLRARRCDLHHNGDFHNWEVSHSEACLQLFFRKRSNCFDIIAAENIFFTRSFVVMLKKMPTFQVKEEWGEMGVLIKIGR